MDRARRRVAADSGSAATALDPPLPVPPISVSARRCRMETPRLSRISRMSGILSRVLYSWRRAPVAQLDRANASGALGREFESLRAHHTDFSADEGIGYPDEVDTSEEDDLELPESGEDAAESLPSAEEPFHGIALLVKFAVVSPSTLPCLPLTPSGRFCGDHRSSTPAIRPSRSSRSPAAHFQ